MAKPIFLIEVCFKQDCEIEDISEEFKKRLPDYEVLVVEKDENINFKF
jgi:hypothetical protein|tara:strand:+ start:48 stop:191 length:144 start_codon:yes stop_codon:yes gene_type:complete